MDSIRKLLKLSSIINFMLGIAVLGSLVYSAFFFVLGFIFLMYSSLQDEELIRNKSKILIIGIVTFPLNLITTILSIIVNDKIIEYEKKVNGINSPPVVYKKAVDKETKKIDILLKIGVGMVFISGILFATTSWDFISNPLKVVFLILFGILFIWLSLFTENRFKLYKSSYIYWLLGTSFLLLSIIALLYFKVFGDLSYQGSGRYLSFVITYITVLGLSFATYLKFPKKYLLYIIYMSVTLIITNIFKHFSVDNANTITVISLILLSINILSTKENTLSKYSKILSYLLFVFILKNVSSSNPLLVLIASLTNIINFYFLTEKNENIESILSLIITYVLLIVSIYNINVLGSYRNILLFMVITFHTLLIKFNIFKVSKPYNYFNYTLYVLVSLTIYLNTILQHHNIITITISSIFLIINILLSKKIKSTKDNNYAVYITPLSIYMLILAVSRLFSIENNIVYIITTVVYVIIHIINREDKTYFTYSIMGLFISILSNIVDKDNLSSILILIPAIYLFVESLNKDKKLIKALSYSLLLLSIYNIIRINNILDLSTFISSIIFIWILIIFIILIKDELIKKISYFAIVVPIYDMVEYFETDYKMIAISIMGLYLTFLAVKFFCKGDASKNIVAIIGIVISISDLLSSSSYLVGIYVGVVGIIVLLIGYFDKNKKPIFITGIIITIANILIQLQNLWEEIPFWLYLLIGGLTLIGIVTYKEINKNKEK